MSDWDRIIASSPVNRTAAIVAGGKSGVMPLGPQGNANFETWDAPPKCQTPPKVTDVRVGQQFGRLTVFGYFDKTTNHNRWVCRCACGLYELRSSKAIKNPKNANDACRQCRHVQHLRRQDEFLRTGTNRDRTA